MYKNNYSLSLGPVGDNVKHHLLLGVFICFAILGTPGHATGSFQSGPGLTTGPNSSGFSLFAASANPSMNALLVDEGESWRLSYTPSLSLTVELGEVDDFLDELDGLVDFISDGDFLDENVGTVLDRFNDVVEELGEAGYLKAELETNLPLLYKNNFLGGSLGVDLSYGIEASVQVLDDPIEIDLVDGITTATSLYIRSAIETALSLSYGGELFADHEWFQDEYSLYAGVSLNLTSLGLSRQVIPLVSIGGVTVEDVLRDKFDSDLQNNVQLGVDVGFVFKASKYRLGFTVENVNEPSFSFDSFQETCAGISLALDRDACFAARTFIAEDRILMEETFIQETRMRVDALYNLTERWNISAAYDLTEYNDVGLFENQWVYASTSYDFKSFFIPSVRMGYKQNLVGTNLSSIAFGASILKYINLDLEFGLESVSADVSTTPRRMGFALSVEERF